MLKPRPMEIINRDCPLCEKVHDVEHHIELSTLPIKGDVVECVVEYYRCPINKIDGEDSWTPTGMLDENLLRLRDAYRAKHNLLTSDEIVSIRKKYGLSQKELSDLFGWGGVTVARYETSHIQDETYDSLLRMVMGDTTFALAQLKKHQAYFGEERYVALTNTLKSMIKAEGNTKLKFQEIRNRYLDFDTESDANGFKLLDIDKLADVLAYFANYVKGLYKVKLMKLLWYNDVLYFNKHGSSMTGLVYQHKPLGALPLAHGEIIFLPTVKVIEEEMELGTSYNIVPLDTPKNPIFTLEEQEILTAVASKFRDVSGKDISTYMHKENAYLNTVEGEVIMYSQAAGIVDLGR